MEAGNAKMEAGRAGRAAGATDPPEERLARGTKRKNEASDHEEAASQPPSRRRSPRLKVLQQAVNAATGQAPTGATGLTPSEGVSAPVTAVSSSSVAVGATAATPAAGVNTSAAISPSPSVHNGPHGVATPDATDGRARRSPRIAAAAATPSIKEILRQEEPPKTWVIRTRRVTQVIRSKYAAKGPHDLSGDGDEELDDQDEQATDQDDLEDDDEDEDDDNGDLSDDQDDHDESDQEDGDTGDDVDDEAGASDGEDQDDDEVDEEDEDDEENGSVASADSRTTTEREHVDRTCIVQVCDEKVMVPAPKPVHADWAAFFAYLATYMEETNQVIVVKATLSTVAKNQSLAALKTPKAPMPASTGDMFMRRFICTHGWPTTSRGTGKRPKRFVRGIGCPYHFRVQWDDAGTQLEVHNGCLWHNHRLDPPVHYPAERMKTVSAESVALAGDMTDWGVPRAQIYDMLLDRNENVFDRDVDNIVTDRRSRTAVKDDDQATAKVLTDFSEKNDGGLITVDETDAHATGVISITTRHMREMFARFGELLLVDCTHKTNKNNYQLCTMMVMDEYGSGQVVQQSLFERNADWHMERALDHLQKANEDDWHHVVVIMVDKDLNEIRVLQARLPNARVLICHFHVIKYLKTAAHKVEFGKLSKDDHDTLEALLKNLVHSDSAGAYKGNLFAIENFCVKAEFMGFYQYLLTNWDACKEMWVHYERAHLPHFKNNTNNRLESFFGKFKKGVKPTSTMAECVTQLINNARRSARKRGFQKRVGREFNQNYDEEMNSVLLCTTHFVADHILPQYSKAIEKSHEYVYEYPNGPDGQCVQVQGSKTYEVDLTDFSCSCEFAKTMRLPCRHAMAYRKYKGGSSVIPLQRIDARWKHATSGVKAVPRFAVRKHDGAQRPPKPLVNTTTEPSAVPRGRYAEAMRVMAPICSELAEIEEDSEFNRYCDFLLEQWQLVRQRKLATTSVMGAFLSPRLQTGDTGGTPASDVADDAASDVADDAPLELSQANSLYSPEMGHIPVVPTDAIAMPRPIELVADNHGRNMDEHGPNMDGKDCEDATETATTAGEVELKLNFNVKAPKHGAPKVDTKKQAAAANARHIQFNKAQTVARSRGVESLQGLLDQLNLTEPSVGTALEALNCVPEKHSEHKAKKPKLQEQAKPVLTTSDFFVLPKTLLKACMRLMPAETVSIHTPAGDTAEQTTSTKGPVQVLLINQVGVFSTDQVRLMNKIVNLRDACQKGKQYCDWLEERVAASIPVTQKEQFADLVTVLRALYPFAPIPGLPHSHVAMLYNANDSDWFCAGLIRAFAARLEAKYGFVRFAGVFDPDPPLKGKGKGKAKPFPSGEALLHQRVSELLKEDGVKHVFAIVNFNNAHWTSVTIDKEDTLVSIYDSFGPKMRFEKLGWDLAKSLGLFSVKSIQTPLQVDGSSCGILSCYKLWQKADPGVPRVMEKHALNRRRFEFVYFVVTGNVVG